MFGHRTAPRSGGIRANPSRKRVSVIGIIALAIGLIPVTGSAREQDAKLTLAYDCRFPSGPQKVSVQIAGTLPSTGTSGESIRPTGAALTWTVPQSVLTGLTERGAIMLTAVATLTTTVAQQGAPATAAWTAGSSVPTPIPSANGLTLTAAATAPAVRAAEPGDVVFAAGALQMTITTMKADGTPTDPPALSVPCTPVQGQDARLGTVPIARPEESGTVPAPTATTDPSQVAPSAPAPAAGAAGAVAPCFGDKTNDFELVAYATGYSNVSKLNAAALVPPACTKIQQGETKVVPAPLSPDGFTHIYQVSVARLDYKGERRLPPATATFLTFGYMPTTATMELRQMPPKLDGEGVPVPM